MRRAISLSPPHIGTREAAYVQAAFDTNWIAPLGPNVDAFEAEFAKQVGVPCAVALSSGTAALHLALELAGVKRGDEVFCTTFTFVASANPILYLGARPVFIDSETCSWNMDPVLLAEELDRARAQGRRVGAVVLVERGLWDGFEGPDMFHPAANNLPLHCGPTFLEYHIGQDGQDGKVEYLKVGSDYRHLGDERFSHYETREDALEVFQDAEELFTYLSLNPEDTNTEKEEQ